MFRLRKRRPPVQPSGDTVPVSAILREITRPLADRIGNRVAAVERRLSNRQKIAGISIFCLTGLIFSMTLLFRAILLPAPSSQLIDPSARMARPTTILPKPPAPPPQPGHAAIDTIHVDSSK